MIRRMLAVVDQASLDNNEIPATLTRAIQLAIYEDSEIFLITCLHFPVVEATHLLSPNQADEVQQALTDQYRSKLTALTDRFHKENIRFNVDVVWHSPIYHAIIEKVKTLQPDLLLKQVNEHGVIARRLTNLTDIQLMKEAPVPTLLVKNPSLPSPMSVIAALDPAHRLNLKTKLDNRVLSAANSLANQLAAPLHAVHCFDPSYWEILLESVKSAEIWADIFPSDHQGDKNKVVTLLKERHQRDFSQTCKDTISDPANMHLVDGQVTTALPQQADKLRAGVVVVGTTFRTGFLGSTAEALVDTLNCDILAIKPLDFDPSLPRS